MLLTLSLSLQNEISEAFPPSEWEHVARVLSHYSGKEAERVHLCILKLAGSDVAKVAQLVETANSDYRDIIFWAESEK